MRSDFQYDFMTQNLFSASGNVSLLASFYPRVQAIDSYPMKHFEGIFIIFVAKPVENFVGSCILCLKPGFEGSCTF